MVYALQYSNPTLINNAWGYNILALGVLFSTCAFYETYLLLIILRNNLITIRDHYFVIKHFLISLDTSLFSFNL